MIDKEFATVCSNAVLKIIDSEWQLTRSELEQAVQNIVKHIIAGAKAEARLEAKGIKE